MKKNKKRYTRKNHISGSKCDCIIIKKAKDLIVAVISYSESLRFIYLKPSGGEVCSNQLPVMNTQNSWHVTNMPV